MAVSLLLWGMSLNPGPRMRLWDVCGCHGSKWLRLDGLTEASERRPLVDQLNSGFGEVLVFLLSSKAGDTGLNLIGADR